MKESEAANHLLMLTMRFTHLYKITQDGSMQNPLVDTKLLASSTQHSPEKSLPIQILSCYIRLLFNRFS